MDFKDDICISFVSVFSNFVREFAQITWSDAQRFSAY
jgi:hypothetical protein